MALEGAKISAGLDLIDFGECDWVYMMDDVDEDIFITPILIIEHWCYSKRENLALKSKAK